MSVQEPLPKRRRNDAPETDSDNVEPVAVPPKSRRRPLVIAASIATICLGSLIFVLAFTALSDTKSVVAARDTIERGATIEAEDLVTVQVGVDPALDPVSADEAESLVGQRAALDIPKGGVVTSGQVGAEPVPTKGDSVVGISLTAAMLPAEMLRVGDPVRVITTPGEQGDIQDLDKPDAIEAAVVGVSTDPVTGNALVNVEVPYKQAPQVAGLAATGKLAIVLDSRSE